MSDKVNMVSAAHYKALRKENDQLRARVDELEEFIKSAPVSTGYCCCGSDMSSHDTRTHPDIPPKDAWDHESELILNRTPAQSLAAHDARVLRGAADKYEAIYGHEWAEDRMSGHLWLRQQADRIEKEGE